MAIAKYVHIMDGLGYTISYQHFQILHGNGAGIDRAVQGFDSEINATIIYLSERRNRTSKKGIKELCFPMPFCF